SEVLELHRLLADVADTHDQCDRLAVVISSMLTGTEAQARLQAVDFFAPCGGVFLLLLLRQLLCILHFQFQFPGGELAQSGIEFHSWLADAWIPEAVLLFYADLPRAIKGMRVPFEP